MDIFEYAESINWNADYFDRHTGYIYMITEASTYENKKIPIYAPILGAYIGFALPKQ